VPSHPDRGRPPTTEESSVHARLNEGPRRRRRGRLLVALAGAPAAAQAATADVAGGATTLKLTPATAKALDALGVSVAPLRPAKAGKSGVSFPVSGGSVNPATGAGTIEHRGGLRLRAGDTTVNLRNFVVNAGSTNTIGVQAGKARLHAFRISLAGAKVTRRGIQTLVGNVKVTLSARGAAALNKAFGVQAFKAGLRIGTASVRVRPGELAFTGGSTSLALDAGAAQALTGLGVAVAPAAPASAGADGGIAFPITEGKVNARTLAGSISHSGGLTFSAGATSVTVSDFVIETAPEPKLTAALGGAPRRPAHTRSRWAEPQGRRSRRHARGRRRQAHGRRRQRAEPGVRHDPRWPRG
jgi:hypothetical protein